MCFWALRPSAAMPNSHPLPSDVWFAGLGTIGLQKPLGQQKHFGIPLKHNRSPARGAQLRPSGARICRCLRPRHGGGKTCNRPSTKGSRSCCLEARCAQAPKTHLLKQIIVVWPCRLRRQGQQKHDFLEDVRFFAFVPQASPKTLGQTNTSGQNLESTLHLGS